MSAATRNSTVNTAVPRRLGARLADFFTLCKPRVNSLIVFTAMIGMFLATPGFPPGCSWPRRPASRWSPARRRRSIASSNAPSTR